ncbi:hypothetical protein PTNB85_07424 [Pyrenophora teres f. teres]|nr:hypothetical protein HRS9139_07456 [Pyrenophora teres f. teres]KAE8830837.1 hypothetical protein PTNB85_07424 [Pyrenophora teres f. teres]
MRIGAYCGQSPLSQRGCTSATGTADGTHASDRDVGLVTFGHGCYGMKLKSSNMCDSDKDNDDKDNDDKDNDDDIDSCWAFVGDHAACDVADGMMPVRSILGQHAAVDMHRV